MIEELTGQELARKVAKFKDDMMMDAIKARVGDDIVVYDVVSRAKIDVFQDGVEVFSFDGVPLIRFYPMTIQHEGDFINGFSMTATTPYEILS